MKYGIFGSASLTTKLNAIAVSPSVVEIAIRSATSVGSIHSTDHDMPTIKSTVSMIFLT